MKEIFRTILMFTARQLCMWFWGCRVIPVLLLAFLISFVIVGETFADQPPTFHEVWHIVTKSDDRSDPQLETDGQGLWVLVWSSNQNTFTENRITRDVGNDYDIWLSYSENNGDTWSNPRPMNIDFAIASRGWDLRPRIATDKNGHWIIVWYSTDSLGPANLGSDSDILVSRSADGKIWTRPEKLNSFANSDGRSADINPHIAYGKDGNGVGKWMVAWQSNYNLEDIGTDHDILWSISADNGETWSEAKAMTNASADGNNQDIEPYVTFHPIYYTSLLVPIRNSSEWLITWTTSEGGSSDLLIARYSNQDGIRSIMGQTAPWTTPVFLNTKAEIDGGDDDSAQVACNGPHCVAVWRSKDNISVARSSNGGGTWTDPHLIRISNSLYEYFDIYDPGIVTDGMGHWVVTWYLTGSSCPSPDVVCSSSPIGSYMATSTDNGETWSSTRSVISEASSFHMTTDQNGAWVAVGNRYPHTIESHIGIANAIPPKVTSIEQLDNNPTNATNVRFEVNFSKPVSGLDREDFKLETSGNITETSILPVPAEGDSIEVSANIGTGTGTIKLLVLDDDSIHSNGNALGGWGTGNGAFTKGPTYTIDDPPIVTLIERKSPKSPTQDSAIFYALNFSEEVIGVDTSAFTLTTTGSISGASVSSVSGSGTTYSVELYTGSGSGKIWLDLIDNDSILDTNNHPLGGWGNGNGSFTAPAFIVDRSQPDTTEARVFSEAGPYTISNQELVFSWRDFNDPETDIVRYEVAFGNDDNPEAYQVFTSSVGLTTTKKFEPVEFPNSFPSGEFPDGKYRFRVRAINAVGLVSDEMLAEVTVDTTAYKVGEAIPLPDDKEWSDIDWKKTKFTPPTHVVLIESAQNFLVGDWGKTISVNWYYSGNDGNEPDLIRNYNTASEPAWEPVIIYATHDDTVRTKAPSVNLGDFKPIIHYNEAIPNVPYDPSQLDTKHLWQDGESLYARASTKEFAFVLLEYTDVSNPEEKEAREFIEIVQIKPHNKTDAPDGEVHVGSRLFPVKSMTGRVPSVTRGGTGSNPQYIYQHRMENSPQDRQIWAIKLNDDPYSMEVIWQRPGLNGVLWPYELRRYTAKWPEDDPAKYQLYARGKAGNLGPKVEIPNQLHAEFIPKNPHVRLINEGSPSGYAYLEQGGTLFHSEGLGWVLLKYATGATPWQDWVGFEVVRCVDHHDRLVVDYDNDGNLGEIPWDIGKEITDTTVTIDTDEYYEDLLPGYIFTPEGDRYAPEIYDDTGQIFAVNTGILEVWWSDLSRTKDPEGDAWPAWPDARVQWPSRVVRYQAGWPEPEDPVNPEDWDDPKKPGKIIIARQNGTGAISTRVYGTDWDIYSENNTTQPGFNPNDEHALVKDGVIFALRNDLGTPETSEPYVLMKYKEQTGNDLWRFRLFKVVTETENYVFKAWEGSSIVEDPYKKVVGEPIQAPIPLSEVEIEGVGDGPWWMDRDGDLWIKAAGDDGESTADITVRYSYKIEQGFYFPDSISFPYPHNEGDFVPWLDNLSGTPSGIPVDVVYTAFWPVETDSLEVGQTVINGGPGIDDLNGQCSVEILFDQSIAQGGNPSVMLIDPVRARSGPVLLRSLPPEINTEEIETAGGETLKLFSDLSLALQKRVGYNPRTHELKFWGVIIEPEFGFQYPILNVMSDKEKSELEQLNKDTGWTDSNGTSWEEAIDELHVVASNPVTDVIVPNGDLSLTTLMPQYPGYITLAYQNAQACGEDPEVGGVDVKVFKVKPDLYTGSINRIYADCAFNETVTLRHSNDFGGYPHDYEFQWCYQSSQGSKPPSPQGDDTTGWECKSDNGLIEYTIKGPNLRALSDNYFSVRYRYTGESLFEENNGWSKWTDSSLAEGWIKRVVGDIDGYTQGGTLGGIQGGKILGPTEERFFDYGNEIDTIINMISKAGKPWTGDIPLNCSDLNALGLIEIYETVLGRGAKLSIDASINDDDANKALLLAASRIADLYMLLGNEAYADAADPTIAFGTEDGQYGAEASSIHCFMNMTGSLLEEELALLRGRDDSGDEGVQLHPLYNRLAWNYTNGLVGGEVAYSNNYNLTDKNGDGSIELSDAKEIFPQGHGDAWGHYLSAIKTYYKLLKHPNYTWESRSESLLVGGKAFTVDYYDERKFATIAAAKARTGAEIVNLTYRSAYVEDPAGQWQGYKDSNPNRAWGLSEWASRAGQGAYFDWVVGNAILPAEDREHTGIQKIDRTTVLELREVASRYQEIQAQLDTADLGLNPLGLATNVIPFDIRPDKIDAGQTHFEQIYDRAVIAMNNAISVFNHANNSTQLLRRQADSHIQFERTVEDREIDFKNRLIEIYGRPYPCDMGPGQLYPKEYDGPDLQHYTYVDPSELVGVAPSPVITYPITVITDIDILDDGSLKETEKEVVFHISTSGDRFGEVIPDRCRDENGFVQERSVPGEIQMARSDLIQARARFERALTEYDNLLASIEDQAELLQAQYNLNTEEINVLNAQLDEQQTLNSLIKQSRTRQLNFRTISRMATIVANALAEFLPKSVGFSNDVTAPGRGAIRLEGTVIAEAMNYAADRESLVELDHQQAMQIIQGETNIVLTKERQEVAIQQQIKQLKQSIGQELTLRFELYTMQEAMQQASGRYLAALARGLRLQEDLARFRRQTAAKVQSERYKDMAFRIFRNDALQKYRAQFDLAARYVYLAAKAYDYETTLLSTDEGAGEVFLTDIVRQRQIGIINPSGLPETGAGLADPLAKMSQNFEVLKGQMGFNNPQQETNRFSLRWELFRIPPSSQGNALWRAKLKEHLVPNLLDLPEFQRYARIFQPHFNVEPGIVIPFETNINAGLNFFGWPSTGGDSSYGSSNFATKVRSAGVWFSNYNNVGGASDDGLSNTPRVYLIPVGIDIQRSSDRASPSTSGQIREFKILDQVLPVPFPIDDSLNSPDWLPIRDTLGDTFANIRRYPSFRAYHDSGDFNPQEVTRNNQLIGRSVWNTKWLLIIPGKTLLGEDPDEGLNRFIDGALVGEERDGNGVSDIKIFFETYAYPGR